MASRSKSSPKSEPHRTQRELSWLSFNERVLEEAERTLHPLMERIKFLSIFSSNLEEFFMVRVSGHRRRVRENSPAPEGEPPPVQVLAEIRRRVCELETRQHTLLRKTILPELSQLGFHLSHEVDHDEAEQIFEDRVLPVLTPMGVDPARPFPTLQGQLLHLCVLLEREGTEKLAFIPLPKVLGRFQILEHGHKGHQVIPVEDFARAFLPRLFQGYHVTGAWSFQILRDMDVDYEEIEDDPGDDFLEQLQKELGRKRDADVIRLVHEPGLPTKVLARLREELEIDEGDIYESPDRILALAGCFQLLRLPSLPSRVFDAPLVAQSLPLDTAPGSLFRRLEKEDILLHHPFDNYDDVLRFLREAAADPDVLAIKQTLYRVSDHSAIVAALVEAARTGKHVSVLVELKARFDEHNNILWARALEDAGVHVVYGLLGLKTHCKIALVVRKEPSGIRRYAHFGTGNYNENSARLYTDISLLTSDEDLCSDAGQLLNSITGFSDPPHWESLAVAPQGLRKRLLEMIASERENAKAGKKALVFAKMNALVDETIMRAIEDAARDGVEFRLLVRGICCLAPNGKTGPGAIRIRSIVDRFLEHSRIYAFHQEGKPKVFIASADWMPRNFDRRIEVMVPIRKSEHKKRLLGILEAYWTSDITIRELQVDGHYLARPSKSTAPQRAQLSMMEEANLNHDRLGAAWNPRTPRQGMSVLKKKKSS